MRLNQTYENALVAWVKSVLTGYIVIWDMQNVQTPSSKYVTLNILTSGLSEPVNSPNIEYNTTDKYKYTLAESMAVQIQLFSDDSYLSDMGKLRRSFYYASTQKAFSTAGLTRQKMENIIDLSALANTGFKFACSLDIFLGYKIDDATVIQTDGEISRVTGTVLGVDFDTNDNI